VLHVNWFEADAFCRWQGRRLPSEAEWERAAAGDAADAAHKRVFPWGAKAPAPEHALLDMRSLACAEVGAHGSGDGPFGHRQLIGNVWEWTASSFGPYPGFVADPYADYSKPWFGTRKVLRGGCFASRGRLLRNTWRNFFTPDRRDLFAGFRTAAPRG
jgi:iron(II)-dependent oxidoreductase